MYKINLVNKIAYMKYCFIILLVGSLACIKPIYFEQDKKVANQATKKFHTLYNKQNYETIYELTFKQARSGQSKDEFTDGLKDLYLKFGEVKNVSLIKAEVNVEAGYREIYLVYNTEFEKNKMIENFVWFVNNEKASLYSYNVTIPSEKH